MGTSSTQDEEMVKSAYKFKFFVTGLIFTILGFSVQFSIITPYLWANILQIVSWLLLGFSSWYALKDCGGLPPKAFTLKNMQGLSDKDRNFLWRSFYLAIAIQVGIRGTLLFI